MQTLLALNPLHRVNTISHIKRTDVFNLCLATWNKQYNQNVVPATVSYGVNLHKRCGQLIPIKKYPFKWIEYVLVAVLKSMKLAYLCCLLRTCREHLPKNWPMKFTMHDRLRSCFTRSSQFVSDLIFSRPF